MKYLAAGAMAAGAAIGALAIWRIFSPGLTQAKTSTVPVAPIAPEGYLSRAYDRLFIEECGDTVQGREDPYPPKIPVEYLRALVKCESDFDPSKAESGAGVGLLQVVRGVLDDYNKLYGTKYLYKDRLDATVNARVACELIGRITRYLPNQDPAAFPKRRFDWTSKREVGLLTLAWNAGWTTKGVSGMIRLMLRDGYTASQITANSIVDHASDYPGIGDTFYKDADRYKKWVARVVNYYFRELRAPAV